MGKLISLEYKYALLTHNNELFYGLVWNPISRRVVSYFTLPMTTTYDLGMDYKQVLTRLISLGWQMEQTGDVTYEKPNQFFTTMQQLCQQKLSRSEKQQTGPEKMREEIPSSTADGYEDDSDSER